MKKADVKSIQEERESLARIADAMHKIAKQEEELINVFGKDGDHQDFGRLHQEKIEGLGKVKEMLGSAVQRLKSNSVRYLVFFVATGFFDKILQAINPVFFEKEEIKREEKPTQQLKMIKKQIKGLIGEIVKYSNANAPMLLQIFSSQYPLLDQKFKLTEEPVSSIDKLEAQPRKPSQKSKQTSLEQFKTILSIIIQLAKEKKKENNSKINEIYRLVQKHQSRDERGDDIYEEVALNWFKFQLDSLRKEKQYLCCKAVFFHQETFQSYKRKCVELKAFTKIQDNPKLGEEQEELSRTIAALMNTKGGVIFLGIVHEFNKPAKVTGFQLEQKNKKDLVKFIRNAVNEVLPKHKGFQLCSEQSQHYYNSAYELNYYISIEFMNVVKRATFENCRDPLKIYQKLYICKIAVKIGHPRYLYYVLKNQGNKDDKKQAQIQFFVRGEQGNQKQNLDYNYDLIYRKLIDYKSSREKGKIDQKNERTKVHEGCLYDMTMKPQTFFLQNSDDEDD